MIHFVYSDWYFQNQKQVRSPNSLGCVIKFPFDRTSLIQIWRFRLLLSEEYNYRYHKKKLNEVQAHEELIFLTDNAL